MTIKTPKALLLCVLATLSGCHTTSDVLEARNSTERTRYTAAWPFDGLFASAEPAQPQFTTSGRRKAAVFHVSMRGCMKNCDELRRPEDPSYSQLAFDMEWVGTYKKKRFNENFRPIDSKIDKAIDEALTGSQLHERVVAEARNTNRSVLLFVHGFNNLPAEAVRRVAELSARAEFPGPSLAFTWPAYGTRSSSLLSTAKGLTHYLYDLQSANYSRDALASLLTRLGNDGQISKIYVVAHSLGSWLTMEALRQIAIADQSSVLEKMGALVLVAPDIDSDVFLKQVERVNASRPWAGSASMFSERTVVFANRFDGALELSEQISFENRVGQLVPGEATDRSFRDWQNDVNIKAQALKAKGLRIISAENFESDWDDTKDHYKAADTRFIRTIQPLFGLQPRQIPLAFARR